MNLLDLYKEGGKPALVELAEKVGSDPVYLYQLATRWRCKRPSPRLAARLIQADPRLTWEDLYADIADMDMEK